MVDREFVIVIDPGHGGSNHGCDAFHGETSEKELSLILAKELAAELEKRLPHAEVVLTRENDRTMTLAERVRLANSVGGDLFLSIHANASESHEQSGYESYLLDLKASHLEAAKTAQRENDEGFTAPKKDDEISTARRQAEPWLVD